MVEDKSPGRHGKVMWRPGLGQRQHEGRMEKWPMMQQWPMMQHNFFKKSSRFMFFFSYIKIKTFISYVTEVIS